MLQFANPFSGLANDRKLTKKELVHAGEFLRLLRHLASDEQKFYDEGCKEVEETIGR